MDERNTGMGRSHLTRRSLVQAFALIGLAHPLSAYAEPLGAIAKKAGLRFGSAVQASSLDDAGLASLLAEQCNSLTPELELKWAALAPRRGEFDTGHADRIAAFAKARDMRLRGHTLLWHKSLPPWFGPDIQWSEAASHIAAVVGRFGAVIDEWDVVNEPIEGDGLRTGPLLQAFGPDYIEKALRTAHEAAPDARLMINEYDIEYSTPDQAGRRRALLALVERLKNRGVPLHGIGVQGHLKIAMGELDAEVFGAFLKAIADLGLTISITELDVKERDYILPATERDRAVAEHVARFLEIALAQPAVRSLTCWGLSDRQSWLQVTDEDIARFPGAWADGSSPGLNRGLPFDASLQPKPMHQKIISAMSRFPR